LNINSSNDNGLAPRREILSWAMFDFANSSYTTVVTTTIFNAYFVKSVCVGLDLATATFYLALATGLANALVVLTAPIIGAIADARSLKKRFLFISTLVCVCGTLGLASVHEGMVFPAMAFLTLASFAFGTSEDLIAAFLPGLAPPEKMGRISAFGWTLGYIGGLLVLALCLAYVSWAQKEGLVASQFVPVTMYIVAVVFAVAATPTFLFLKERRTNHAAIDNEGIEQVSFEAGQKAPEVSSLQAARAAFHQIFQTFLAARKYRDLFTFLVSLLLYSCGSTTVVLLAAVYSEQVMGFKTSDTIALIMAVNVAGALGAFVFGFMQDHLGSVKTLMVSLGLWVLAIFLAIVAPGKEVFWVAAAFMGLAMGSSASAGRALVGLLAPPAQAAEFFGLWGLTVKFSAIIGPMTYSLFTFLTKSNYRLSLVSTLLFFVLGLLVCTRVNEKRGRLASRGGEV
jgi:UMF1 family MFS transporter